LVGFFDLPKIVGFFHYRKPKIKNVKGGYFHSDGHAGMFQTAKLETLAMKIALKGEGKFKGINAARNGIQLNPPRRYGSAVDDILSGN